MSIFQLDNQASLYYITHTKQVLDTTIEPQPTPGQGGWEFPLLKYIT